MEDGGVECAVWRGEGRSDLRPEAHVENGAGADDAALCERDFADHRAGDGYSGAGCVHGRADDGVDHGHIFDDGGTFRARSGDGETGVDRRLGRAERGDGARAAVRGRRSVQAEENSAARRDRGDPGIWECRSDGGATLCGEKSEDYRVERYARRRYELAGDRSAQSDSL